MFTKKLFGVAGAALLMVSGAANAQGPEPVDLSATPATPAAAPTKYASEYVASATSALGVMHPGFMVDPAIRLPAGSYVRVDLTGAGAKFVSHPEISVGHQDVNDATGKSYAIFELNNPLPEPDKITFTAASGALIQVESTSGTVTATVKMYDDGNLTAATSNSTATLDTQMGAIAMFTPGIKVELEDVQNATATTSVTGNFLNFASGGGAGAPTGKHGGYTKATLGMITVSSVTGVRAPGDMMQVRLYDLLKAGSTLTVEGDFTLTEDKDGKQQPDNVSFNDKTDGKFAEDDDGSITFTLGAPLADEDAISAGLDTTRDNADDDLDDLIKDAAFVLTAGEEAAIQESTYDYTLKFAAKDDTVVLQDATGMFGKIDRDGTSVDIPYITTFDEYNQRLVLTNKGSRDADYQVEFRTENGVTATAGTYASGTLPAGEVMVIKMTDLVDLEGGTRAAGEITINAPSSTITVATTQVNIMDRSTDTVVLHSN